MNLLYALALSPASASAPIEEEPSDTIIEKRNLHGFRLGYSYAPEAPTYSDRVKSPHMFVIGYEFTQRLTGGDWLNVVTVENLMLSGLNQSLIVPTVNVLVGFEINNAVQLGVGPNINLFDPNDKILHMVVAGGFAKNAGAFNVPIHAFYIPDIDGDYRVGLTTGVNW